MENQCSHCNQTIDFNFCSRCGQKKYKRIDKAYILEELQYTIIHTNKGFLYSVKNILKNPGRTARGFIDGNRVNHYKPILLTFVLSGVATFVSIKLIGVFQILKVYFQDIGMFSPFMRDFLSIQTSYNAFLMILFIPLIALFTKIAFKKWNNNYFEHIVMNTFILSFHILISIIVFQPIMFMLRKDTQAVFYITGYQMLIMPVILIWFYKNFYHDKPFSNIIGRVFLSLLLILLGFIILMIMGFVLAYLIIQVKGPDALNYFNPIKA